jgi:hypothetical protein
LFSFHVVNVGPEKLGVAGKYIRINNTCEIELQVSKVLNFKYYGKPRIVKDIEIDKI